MKFSSIDKKVKRHVEDQKAVDEENISLKEDEKTVEGIDESNLDAGVTDRIREVRSEQAGERDRIENTMDSLKQEKGELIGEIDGEIKKSENVEKKLDSISDNKYATGVSDAKRKNEELVQKLEGLKEELDEAGESSSSDGNSDYGSFKSGGFLERLFRSDENSDSGNSGNSPLHSDYGNSVFGGEFVPLLVTGQQITSCYLNGKMCDVYDHPFEAHSYRICNQGSADPRIQNTCGLCSSGSIVNKAGGNTTERKMIDLALPRGWCDNEGFTSPKSWNNILNAAGIKSEITTGMSLEDLAKKVEEGRGAIIAVNASLYLPEVYGPYKPGEACGHALVLESIVRDHSTGEILEYIVSDSNAKSSQSACIRVPAQRMEDAFEALGYCSVVTKEIIW